MIMKRWALFLVHAIVLLLAPGVSEGSGYSIVAWGLNNYGQCNVFGLNEGFVEVAGGWVHSLGLKEYGSIFGWGYNHDGQCNTPAPNTDFVAVAAGGHHSLGLKEDSSIVAWGWNLWGQCNVPFFHDFVAVAGGYDFSLGLKADSSIVAWGNLSGPPEPNTDFVAIAAGALHGLGLKEDGSIVCWGHNNYGQCDVPEPNEDFMAVTGGCIHSLGLKEDSSIICWGHNNYGQCDVPEPNEDFVDIAAGGGFPFSGYSEHSLGLKEDGSIVCWGWNYYGQCNVPSPNQDFVGLAAGSLHSLGLQVTGTGVETQTDSEILHINAIHPNPVSSTATVQFSSPGLSHVSLKVFDMTGRIMRNVEIGTVVVGQHTATWDGRNDTGEALSSGIYFIRLTGDGVQSNSSRLVLIR